MAVWIIGISSPLWEISLSSWGSKRRLPAIPKNCRWWGLLYAVCKTEWNANPYPHPFSNILVAPVFQLFNFWMEFFAEACKTDSKELTSSSFPVSSPSLRPSSTHTDRLYDHCKTVQLTLTLCRLLTDPGSGAHQSADAKLCPDQLGRGDEGGEAVARLPGVRVRQGSRLDIPGHLY